MRIIGFDGSDYPTTSGLCWIARLEERNDRLRKRIMINRNCRTMFPKRNPIEKQNERLRNRIAINRLCRAMYREPRSTQNMLFALDGDFRPVPRHLRLVK
jgi:hypothetical protein